MFVSHMAGRANLADVTEKAGTGMKVIVFGATGMAGQGVLRECLLDDRVARVLAVGRTLLAMAFDAYMFRPGFIQPRHGITSKTGWYRTLYKITGPLYPLLARIPGLATTTDQLGRAMIHVGLHGSPTRTLTNRDLNTLP